MLLKIRTNADMSNIDQAMKNAGAEIMAQTGQELKYYIEKKDDLTTIDIPQVTFMIKKGRFNGMKQKIRKYALKKAIEIECRKQGYKAEIEIT